MSDLLRAKLFSPTMVFVHLLSHYNQKPIMYFIGVLCDRPKEICANWWSEWKIIETVS